MTFYFYYVKQVESCLKTLTTTSVKMMFSFRASIYFCFQLWRTQEDTMEALAYARAGYNAQLNRMRALFTVGTKQYMFWELKEASCKWNLCGEMRLGVFKSILSRVTIALTAESCFQYNRKTRKASPVEHKATFSTSGPVGPERSALFIPLSFSYFPDGPATTPSVPKLGSDGKWLFCSIQDLPTLTFNRINIKA